MYFDEDGDLAHEFYEEVVPDYGKPWMRRITENLMHQVIFSYVYCYTCQVNGFTKGCTKEFVEIYIVILHKYGFVHFL